ncbi:division/cell wall cluster transcriptional repressor MraZ [Zooshikella marina]|uniref:Transcriptional regulator MraZ n=1 Tax=Zooshikella ganghwensis TaxID=202772 RepID=A0A4V1INZ3_9GAMM|nr:division/cell wall cluster transcriptional repressor MraZ [Zooshikella ganghwensis]MBU2707327.1 division/cell wall cluster transcriptional repressor MraZ [Zooshikella ganghwensis]RDH45431.1 transcriptional regulator MraZ [Zooshikella ganghwensis]
MFRGVNAISLDAKGRLAIPSRYREVLSSHCNGSLVATIDTEEPCLLIYPIDEWEEIQAKIEALPSFNPVARRIQRLLIGHATDLEIDGSGRVLIPPLLRDYAGLEKKVILLGQGKKFELWSELRWSERRDAYLAEASQGSEMPDELQSLSL